MKKTIIFTVSLMAVMTIAAQQWVVGEVFTETW